MFFIYSYTTKWDFAFWLKICRYSEICLQSLRFTDSLNSTEKQLLSPFLFYTGVNGRLGDTCHYSFLAFSPLTSQMKVSQWGCFLTFIFSCWLNMPSFFTAAPYWALSYIHSCEAALWNVACSTGGRLHCSRAPLHTTSTPSCSVGFNGEHHGDDAAQWNALFPSLLPEACWWRSQHPPGSCCPAAWWFAGQSWEHPRPL